MITQTTQNSDYMEKKGGENLISNINAEWNNEMLTSSSSRWTGADSDLLLYLGNFLQE